MTRLVLKSSLKYPEIVIPDGLQPDPESREVIDFLDSNVRWH